MRTKNVLPVSVEGSLDRLIVIELDAGRDDFMLQWNDYNTAQKILERKV